MADMNTLMGPRTESTQSGVQLPNLKKTGQVASTLPYTNMPVGGTYDDADLIEIWKDIRIECIDPWPIFERQWHRNVLYTLGRQWIEYYASVGWRDKRMAQWVPRPVTNKCKETVSAIRSMFSAIHLGATVRPNGADPQNVSAAATADELEPLLYERHQMDLVQNEADFWLLTCGNSFFHVYVEYDMKYGTVSDPSMECADCGEQAKTSEVVDASNTCPTCSSPNLNPALDDNGDPILNNRPKGRPITIALSPLELTFPNYCARFDDLPYVVRRRWRAKRYYESHPVLKDLVPTISWQKTSTDPSLQLFKNLSRYNDMGIGVLPSYLSGGLSGAPYEEGITEYEVWMKPTEAYPQGLVFRVIGEKAEPTIVHLEDSEAVPGPLPYTDADGNPLFTFAHTGYEHVGGRCIASGALDPIIQKQDQLNQLDSSVLLTVNRMSNPVWMIPKGAEPTKVTGMPGLVIEWNAMAFGGTAKPERLEGVGPHPSLAVLREQYLADIEDLAGTHEILKGQKPGGVDAFNALQLMKELSQSRFAGVFGARGHAYKNWFKFAIELEREFGPDEMTKAVLSPARKWTFKNFKRAQLQGSISVVVEDGSNVPKTSLGMRAALDHASQLGLVNLQDPDQQYEGLKLMGLTKLVPTLDINIQSALQKQQAFEDWAQDQAAMASTFQKAQVATAQYTASIAKIAAQHEQMVKNQPPLIDGTPAPPPPSPPMPPPPNMLDLTPLKWHDWYDAPIHVREFLKWTNGDVIRDLLTQNPALEPLLSQHLQELQAHLPGAKAEPPKVNFTFNGQDLADPQIRQLFDKIEGLPPGDPSMTPAKRPAQQLIKADVSGGGRAMRNSNAEATQGTERAGTKPGAPSQGPA